MMLFLGLAALAALAVFLWKGRSGLHVARALRAYRRGDETATLEAFARAQDVGRLGAEMAASYAYLALKAGRTNEARVALRRLLDARTKPPKESDRRLLQTYYSLVLWKEGDLEGAIEVLEGLYAQGYRTAGLYGNLGYLLQERGDLARAEVVCLEALDWDPEGPVILDNLVALRMAQGNDHQARELSARLLALEPRFPEAWYAAGRLAEATDPEGAIRHYRRALELPFNALTTVDRATVEAALMNLTTSETRDGDALGN